ncbi:hypothetical protein [Enterocloster sp.]|uniref:hypothetical protein n=1 Tax=Enterocloster sp. TaxID=2719315 RepID=UPI00399EF74B
MGFGLEHKELITGVWPERKKRSRLDMMGWTEQFIIEAICRHTEQELRSDETKTENEA